MMIMRRRRKMGDDYPSDAARAGLPRRALLPPRVKTASANQPFSWSCGACAAAPAAPARFAAARGGCPDASGPSTRPRGSRTP
eukprot:1874364-Pyramimonas_sp.AAC.1